MRRQGPGCWIISVACTVRVRSGPLLLNLHPGQNQHLVGFNLPTMVRSTPLSDRTFSRVQIFWVVWFHRFCGRRIGEISEWLIKDGL